MNMKPDARMVIGIAGLAFIAIYGFIMITGYGQVSSNDVRTADKDPDGYYIFHTLLTRLGYRFKTPAG